MKMRELKDKLLQDKRSLLRIGLFVLVALLAIGIMAMPSDVKKEEQSAVDNLEVKVDSASINEIGVFPDHKVEEIGNPFSEDKNVKPIEAFEESINELDGLGKKNQEENKNTSTERRNQRGNESGFDPYGNPDNWNNNSSNSQQVLGSTRGSYQGSNTNQGNQNNTTHVEQKPEEDDYYVESWSSDAVSDSYEESDSKGETTYDEIEAVIMGTTLKKDKVTPQNPRVYIRTLEDFYIDGVLIPEGKRLIAYATLGREVTMNIRTIPMEGNSINTNIVVKDHNGQPGHDRHGGVGSEVSNDISNDVIDEISSNSEVQKVPGLSNASKKLFKKKNYAYITRDLVKLQISK